MIVARAAGDSIHSAGCRPSETPEACGNVCQTKARVIVTSTGTETYLSGPIADARWTATLALDSVNLTVGPTLPQARGERRVVGLSGPGRPGRAAGKN